MLKVDFILDLVQTLLLRLLFIVLLFIYLINNHVFFLVDLSSEMYEES